MVTTMDTATARERARKEFDEASQLLRAGELSQAELRATVSRMEVLAGQADDEDVRVEIRGLCNSLRQLPELIGEQAMHEPLQDSSPAAEIERIADWAWEGLPTVEARIARVRQALSRIDRLREGDLAESYMRRTRRTELLDLLASLEEKKNT
jgi:hypothetical protein